MRTLLLGILLLLPVPAVHAAGADELLEPDKAFRFSARALDAATVEVRYAIADGYYLYRDRFRFAAEPASVTLGPAQFPKGQVHEDKFFGKQEIYRKEVRIRVPLEAAGAERLKLLVTSQGCADLGVCYVPQVQGAELRLASLGSPRSSIFKESEPFASSPERTSSAVSEDVRFAGVLESGRLWLVAAVFFGAGLLLTFTPCVLPMIPILSGIIVGEGRTVTRGHAALVSLAYVLGNAGVPLDLTLLVPHRIGPVAFSTLQRRSPADLEGRGCTKTLVPNPSYRLWRSPLLDFYQSTLLPLWVTIDFQVWWSVYGSNHFGRYENRKRNQSRACGRY